MSVGLWLLLNGEKLSLRAQPRRASLGALCLLLALYQFGLTFFGGSYTAYGYGMMAFAFLLSAVCLAFDRKANHLPFYLALSLILIYVLGIKVHERYLLPALPLLLTAYVLTRDRRLLGLCVGFSITTFINTAIVLVTPFSMARRWGISTMIPSFSTMRCAYSICCCAAMPSGWPIRPAAQRGATAGESGAVRAACI